MSVPKVFSSVKKYTLNSGCLEVLEILKIYSNLKSILERLEISWHLIAAF